MKALVTGGAGFLGSHIADWLLARGEEVLVIDTFVTGKRANLAEARGLEVVEGSVADAALMDAVCQRFRPTHVVHAAASYRDPDDWREDVETNVNGTINIVRAAQRAGAQHLVYLQTALCYGRPQERPITLDHPIAPFSSYALTKCAGESYVAMSGLPSVSLRLANVYGPRHFSGPMPAFYKRLRASQRCTVVKTRRDFIDVADVLALVERILEPGAAVGCFNVSSGRDCTIAEIFERMARRMERDVTLMDLIDPTEDDVASLLLDPSATEKAFGWRARTELDEGLRRLIDWYDRHGVGDTYTHLRVGRG
jgi:nucleoside-diphosphate-sugar epimerase